MKITIISLNYAPEDSAIGLYSAQLATHFVKLGWEVKVICGFPYYPFWKISNEYLNCSTFMSEEIDGVEVLRYKQYVPRNPSFFSRVLQIIDFTIGSFFNTLKIKESDVVFSVVPFTSSVFLGVLLSRRLKINHWVHIQDFEFDAAFESGVISNSFIGSKIKKMFLGVEKKVFDKANSVSTISAAMMNKLKQKTVSNTFFLPNWIDENFVNPEKFSKHKLLDSNKFKILYSGNIGAKQDWDFFVKIVSECAQYLDVHFFLVGEGAQKEYVLNETTGFTNLTHFNPVAYSELNNLLCSADLHILFQKSDVLDTVMPSKILGMMSSARPSIVTGDLRSEVRKVFEESNGGEFYSGLKFEEVVAGILRFKSDPDFRNRLGNNAREYSVRNYSKNRVLDSFSERMKDFVHENA